MHSQSCINVTWTEARPEKLAMDLFIDSKMVANNKYGRVIAPFSILNEGSILKNYQIQISMTGEIGIRSTQPCSRTTAVPLSKY
jgi:hypothetical protein